VFRRNFEHQQCWLGVPARRIFCFPKHGVSSKCWRNSCHSKNATISNDASHFVYQNNRLRARI